MLQLIGALWSLALAGILLGVSGSNETLRNDTYTYRYNGHLPLPTVMSHPVCSENAEVKASDKPLLRRAEMGNAPRGGESGNNVALVLSGGLRGFVSDGMWRGMLEHLVIPLERDGARVTTHLCIPLEDLPSMATMPCAVSAALRLRGIYTTMATSTLPSIERAASCFATFLPLPPPKRKARGRKCGGSSNYTHFIRARPDLLWYEDVLPLSAMLTSAISARARSLSMHAGDAYIQAQVSTTPTFGSLCKCAKTARIRLNTSKAHRCLVLDDQFAVVPAPLAAAYFLRDRTNVTVKGNNSSQPPRNTTHWKGDTECFDPKFGCFVNGGAGQELKLTKALLAAGVPLDVRPFHLGLNPNFGRRAARNRFDLTLRKSRHAAWTCRRTSALSPASDD